MIKLQLIFRDRVGIIADITAMLGEDSINILSMEVDASGDRTFVYFETQAEDLCSSDDLMRRLKEIPGLLEISTIRTMPQEKRERSLEVILNSVSDGIVAIDEHRRIIVANRVARNIFGCKDPEIIGRPIQALNLPDLSMLECLRGKRYHNVPRKCQTPAGLFHFFASAQPFKDSNGRIVGAVEVMKDMKEIKQLANFVADPARITFEDIIGKSPAITSAIAFAKQVARSNAVISIRGESGTGKELFAQAIHHASGLSGLFLPINCATLPEQLLESELFGYEGGSFTGADKQGKVGLFEKAKDGTIFLDEIAEMPPNCQAKLLRVIQERRVRRIGGSAEIPINARIVTATSKNLESMVRDNLFRDDLYYRINVLPIYLPALRERLEDIPLLAEHFLFQLNYKLNKGHQLLTKGALEKLSGHAWPGNIRELRNVIERAAILGGANQISQEFILFCFEGCQRQEDPGGVYPSCSVEGLRDQLDSLERKLLQQALDRTASIRQAARQLRISHSALLNKMRKHKLGLVQK